MSVCPLFPPRARARDSAGAAAARAMSLSKPCNEGDTVPIWRGLADNRSPPAGVLPEGHFWEIEKGSGGQLNRTGFCLQYFDRRERAYRVVLYAKQDFELDSTPPDFKRTHHLRAYYRWLDTAKREGRIYDGDRVDFCLGFAIKAGVLTPNSCANAIAYPDRHGSSDGRALPEATYHSLLQMLNDNAVPCVADAKYDGADKPAPAAPNGPSTFPTRSTRCPWALPACSRAMCFAWVDATGTCIWAMVTRRSTQPSGAGTITSC